jgi:hypothetical protein
MEMTHLKRISRPGEGFTLKYRGWAYGPMAL